MSVITARKADSMLQEFLDSCYAVSHSKTTVHGYRSAIVGSSRGFRKFLAERYGLDEIELCEKIQSGELNVYHVLRSYVIFLDKEGLKPNSIKQFYHAVKGYLIHLGVEVYAEKCKQYVKLPKIQRNLKEPLTKDILVRVIGAVSFKLRVVILIAVSSGMRIGEIAGLRISDIDFSCTPTKIRVRAENTKTREERETFLTSEATVALKDYLNRYFGWNEKDDNSHLDDKNVFGRSSIGKYVRNNNVDEQKASIDLLENMLHSQLKKIPSLNRISKNGRRLVHFHAFREFFYTATSNATESNFAHALMGHHSYLDTYYTLSEKEKGKMYLKAEASLTIADFSKIEEELEQTKEKQKENEEFYNKLKRLIKQDDPSYEKFLELFHK